MNDERISRVWIGYDKSQQGRSGHFYLGGGTLWEVLSKNRGIEVHSFVMCFLLLPLQRTEYSRVYSKRVCLETFKCRPSCVGFLVFWLKIKHSKYEGFPGGSVTKNPPASVGDARDSGLISGSERSPGVGNDNPLQNSCLKHSMEREAWWATVHGVTKRQMWLSNWAQLYGILY